jgi:uracil phosphoribosyltransferase
VPHLFDHPLILDRLAKLRDRNTPPQIFRALVHDLSTLLFIEASRDLELGAAAVRTPLDDCPSKKITDTIGLFPILRAGLGMAQSILDLVPEAQVWHLGLYRDHDTLQPVTYYQKLTGQPTVTRAFVLDPMLATGGSALAAVTMLKTWGVTRVKFISLIGAPEGVRRLREAHPEVPIYLGALDTRLNELGYIVPGLGDAGDRQFAT